MANRYWVGGTGNFNDAGHWSTSSGGGVTGGAPVAGDACIFDAASGAGTCTVTADINTGSITMGAWTSGVFDNSINNNNVTLTGATGTAFNGSGTVTRTLKLGNGTWNLTGSGVTTPWNVATTTGLTFLANSSSIIFENLTATLTKTFVLGGLTYNNLTIKASGTPSATLPSYVNLGGAAGLTFNNFTIEGPNWIDLPAITITVNGVFTATGLAANPLMLRCGASASMTTITSPNNSVISGVALREVTFAGAGTHVANNSIHIGRVSGITVNNPTGGGGSAGMVGG